jgi:methionyl-tRNA formyltransferase
MVNDDSENVGMTLLRVDRGVDTGPVYGQFRVTDVPAHESHTVTQHRAVLEHLDAIRDTLLAVAAGLTAPLDTSGRPSATWGQPWLSAYVKMRMRKPKPWDLPERRRLEAGAKRS